MLESAWSSSEEDFTKPMCVVYSPSPPLLPLPPLPLSSLLPLPLSPSSLAFSHPPLLPSPFPLPHLPPTMLLSFPLRKAEPPSALAFCSIASQSTTMTHISFGQCEFTFSGFYDISQRRVKGVVHVSELEGAFYFPVHFSICPETPVLRFPALPGCM